MAALGRQFPIIKIIMPVGDSESLRKIHHSEEDEQYKQASSPKRRVVYKNLNNKLNRHHGQIKRNKGQSFSVKQVRFFRAEIITILEQ